MLCTLIAHGSHRPILFQRPVDVFHKFDLKHLAEIRQTMYTDTVHTVLTCLHVQPINTPLEYCRHVTHDVFWLKVKRRSETSKPRFHGSERVR